MSFWEHFGLQNGAKNRQKSDPESKHFLDDCLERFWHPSTLKSEHMARDVLQKSHFHPFQFLSVSGFIFDSKRVSFWHQKPSRNRYKKTINFGSIWERGREGRWPGAGRGSRWEWPAVLVKHTFPEKVSFSCGRGVETAKAGVTAALRR